MNYFHSYIKLIIVIKLIFVVMTMYHLYLKVKGESDSDLDKRIVYWKERLEFLFVILMSMLLIYLFNPRHNHNIMIDHHTKILLYLFGFILLITAKWHTFFEEANWFKNIQKIIGEE